MRYKVKTFSIISRLGISVGNDIGERIEDWLEWNPDIEIVSANILD